MDGAVASAVSGALIVTPGDDIIEEGGYVRGHGTYVSHSLLVANVAGEVERVGKLISVRPLHGRYVGEVGDVVVGRVTDVDSKRWRVDVGSRTDAVLPLSSANLTGGDQRRRTVEDQLAMRNYFSEGDVVTAEVHSVLGDGTLTLHARSTKYGKLENGVVASAPPALIRRLKQHSVSLPGLGADVVLGVNGYVWITATHGGGGAAGEAGDEGHAAAAGHDAADAGIAEAVEARKRAAAERVLTHGDRMAVATVYNAIAMLAAHSHVISPTSITAVAMAAADLGIPAKAMLTHESEVAILTQCGLLDAATEVSGGAGMDDH